MHVLTALPVCCRHPRRATCLWAASAHPCCLQRTAAWARSHCCPVDMATAWTAGCLSAPPIPWTNELPILAPNMFLNLSPGEDVASHPGQLFSCEVLRHLLAIGDEKLGLHRCLMTTCSSWERTQRPMCALCARPLSSLCRRPSSTVRCSFILHHVQLWGA